MKLKCNHCSTIIENDFSFSKFEKLSKEHLNFVEVFLVCRGNIIDVEKELGVSYPTVRSKLDEVNCALGLTPKKENTMDKKKIMDMLEKGEISSVVITILKFIKAKPITANVLINNDFNNIFKNEDKKNIIKGLKYLRKYHKGLVLIDVQAHNGDKVKIRI